MNVDFMRLPAQRLVEWLDEVLGGHGTDPEAPLSGLSG